MKKIGSFFITLFFSSLAWADVQVQSTVDRNRLPLGDSLVLSVTVQTGDSASIGEPRLPGLDGFQLVNRSNSMSSRSIFQNGSFQFIRTQTFNFVLSPERAGQLTIGAIDVIVGGKSYTTKPIYITVDDSGSAPRRNTRPQQQTLPEEEVSPEEESYDPIEEADKLFDQLLQRRGFPTNPNMAPTQPINPNEAFFIQVEVDKNQVYEGEQITASWYLYTQNDVRDIDTLKYPSLTGFWKEDIEVATTLNFQTEVINGIAYRKALLASYALFPIKAGTATIDPYKARCTVIVRSFGGFMGQPYTFTKASQPIKISVLPLPPDKPKSFAGAVGQFEAKVSNPRSSVPANEPFSIKIRFEGRGNAKLIEAPSLKLPDSIEQFDTKNESKFFPDGRSFKEFEMFLVPRAVGNIELPGFEFSYFDINQKKYITTVSDPLKIEVVAGRGGESVQSQRVQGTEKKRTEVKKELPGLVYGEDYFYTVNKHKNIIWLFIFAVTVLYLSYISFRDLSSGQKTKSLLETLNQRFDLILKLSKSDFRKSGAQSVNSIYHVLGQMSDLESGNDSLEQLLNATPPSVKKELEGSIRDYLKYFEAIAFAPEAALGDMKDEKILNQKINELKKLLVKAVSVYETKS